MSNTNTGGPAFPMTGMDFRNGQQVEAVHQRGMTLRQYAAIKLKVPDSGTDWLDDMIRKSQRDDFAAKAMPFEFKDYWDCFAELENQTINEFWREEIAESCYAMADAMLRAREAA